MLAHMEPGKDLPPLSRLTVSMSAEDEAQMLKLKHRLEATQGRAFTVSAVIRLAIACLCEREGV